MANAFITIGNGTGSWRTSKDPNNPGRYLQYAPYSYQICVGVSNCRVYSGPYWDYYNKKGWFQGCWFVRSPLLHNMLRSDFIALMTKVNDTIKSKYPQDRDHCPVFKGATYSDVYVQVEKCFQEIIALLKSETGSEDWTYDEGSGPTIENSLKFADKFVENWEDKEKKEKIRKAHNVQDEYNKLRKNGYSAEDAMKTLKN
tara:strand:+ start:134 stop:733 length:600 start_codon:yes stop_codon:yes gene_type:complete